MKTLENSKNIIICHFLFLKLTKENKWYEVNVPF